MVNKSTESLFPGHNESLPESASSSKTWKSPEYKFWAYFFKTISTDEDDYYKEFSILVEQSKNGKIDWDFWNSSSPSSSTNKGGSSSGGTTDYEKAVKVLMVRVTKGDFSFGQDDVKKFGNLVKDIVNYHDKLAKQTDSTNNKDKHIHLSQLWVSCRDVLSKVSVKENGPNIGFIAMGTVLVIAVFWYLQQQSKEFV